MSESLPKKSSSRRNFRWDVFIIDLASRFGVGGAVVLTLLLLFVTIGTREQHLEFIDKFFLLKFPKENNNFLIFVLLGMIVLMIVQILHFRSRLKIKNERIKELEADKRLYENKFLK